MARCTKCNKYVGCSCNLNEQGLCAACEQQLKEEAAKAAQQKIQLEVKLPKQD